MKRHGQLFNRLVSFENLLAAAAAARRGKRFTRNVARFDFSLEQELFSLQAELRSRTYRPGPYHTFTIREPKARLISAAPYRDRVIHHALCRVIEPIFERTFIKDSYACRVAKGTHLAVEEFSRHARRDPYVLKCDIATYFPSVDHDLGAFNRNNNWEGWETATAALSEDDLVALVKALTMLDNRYSAGSVAGVVWVYPVLERRNRQRAHSLDDWISTRSDNFYCDFKGRRDWKAGAYGREIARQKQQDEEHRAAVARKVERTTAAHLRSERANAERVTILGELEPLSPTARLICMAGRASHPPHYFPGQWADITEEDLMAFDAASRNALLQWLVPMRKGPWKRLYDRLKRIDDRHPM